MDHHIPQAVVDGLRRRDIDVLTALENHVHELADPELLDRAGELGRVLVSQDRDLIVEAVRRQRAGIAFSGLIWGSQLSHTLARTLDDLELISLSYDPEDMTNQIQQLPL